MEKVIATEGLERHKISEINELLEKGWSVKSVTLSAAGGEYGFRAYAVFVLEKQDE